MIYKPYFLDLALIFNEQNTKKCSVLKETKLKKSPQTDIEVEFVRKRYLFRQSQPSALITVKRSSSEGPCTVQWQSVNLHPLFMDNYSPIRARLDTTMSSTGFSEHDDQSMITSQGHRSVGSIGDVLDEDQIDWGSGWCFV